MKAPPTVRLIVDKDGRLQMFRLSLNEARRDRSQFSRMYPHRAPFAVATYDLRKPAGVRAAITLPERRRAK